jgi:hypothetical protein
VDALVQIIASAIGGLVAGYFVVVGVRLQFRRQSEAALRALMVEVAGNREAAAEMTRSPTQTFELGHPDPGWLKHSIWDSQLPYAVQLFDEGTLIMVRRAYSLLEAVPAMIIPEHVRLAVPGSSHYARGGWVDAYLIEISKAFQDPIRLWTISITA